MTSRRRGAFDRRKYHSPQLIRTPLCTCSNPPFAPPPSRPASCCPLSTPPPRTTRRRPPPPPASTPSVAAPAAPTGPEAFRQRINDRLKTALKASDDEWSVIQPLLEKVEEKQREVLTNRFGGLMRGGGPGGERRRPADNGGNAAQAAGQGEGNRPARREGNRPQPSAEAAALETALQDDNTNVNDVKTRLAALRAERAKANADLASARTDLQKVLNMRQEAVLVLAGMLE